MIEAAAADLRRLFPEDKVVDKLQVAVQEAALSDDLERTARKLAEYETELDRLRRERRGCEEMREEFEERAGEIALTLERFGLLASVYESDVDRLAALEEGAAALMAGARRPCPLCSRKTSVRCMGSIMLSARGAPLPPRYRKYGSSERIWGRQQPALRRKGRGWMPDRAA